MQITRVTVEFSSEPKAHPVRDALQLLDRDGSCTVRVETDDGIVGESRTYFGRVASSPGLLAAIVTEQLGPAVIGMDPFLVRDVRRRLWELTDYQGSSGLTLFGISAIDVALWDLMARRWTSRCGSCSERRAPRSPPTRWWGGSNSTSRG